MSQDISAEIHSLSPSAIIDLYRLEITGETPLRFHAGTNGLTASVVWQGETFMYLPIEMDGFEVSSQGLLPSPSLRVSNVTGAITAVLQEVEDRIIGSRLYRIRTFQKFLDAVNFPGGVNPTSGSDAYPEELFFVEQKTDENPVSVEFKLVSAMELDGVKFPRRKITAGHCAWRYRGADCGFTGGDAWSSGVTYAADSFVSRGGKFWRARVSNTNFDPLDSPTKWKLDVCGLSLAECKLRHGNGLDQPLPYGAFPGTSRLPNV